ncbi:hypothetical protein Caka_2895 [Coraliomargarita akajimensis DSM 45221]|uniref:Uncharacterized protein n=2 Tax=Coraliomargarita TaxID=442430 RepID=D5ER64_CORAD|nr:hypothetical protein Caka_2895 [Coraliomargarita akajimensis DSM 45221]
MVSPPEKYISFVPILEFNRTDIIEAIRVGIIEADLPDVVLTTFPFDAILESTWSHWKVLAEQWINDGYPLNDNLCQMFEENKNVIAFRKAREALLYRCNEKNHNQSGDDNSE